MPEAVVGALIGGVAIVFVGLIGACVRLAVNGRRKGNPGTAPSCSSQGTIAGIKQEIGTFHPQLAHALEKLADAEEEQSKHLVRIATLLEERLPIGGGR